MAKGGVRLLSETPKVVVGTIHSVKGGEADVVYLLPDLSQAGMAQWVGADIESAAIRRLFYVGMTRARESLVLCNPASRLGVQL